MDMDIETGILYVQGKAYRTRRGMLIGSPIAAGGSSLVVGLKERDHDEILQSGLRRHLSFNVFRRRWMDDVVYIVREDAPEWVWTHVRGSAGIFLYGEGLRLARVFGRESFGFLWEVDGGGTVQARPRWPFLHRWPWGKSNALPASCPSCSWDCTAARIGDRKGRSTD